THIIIQSSKDLLAYIFSQFVATRVLSPEESPRFHSIASQLQSEHDKARWRSSQAQQIYKKQFLVPTVNAAKVEDIGIFFQTLAKSTVLEGFFPRAIAQIDP